MVTTSTVVAALVALVAATFAAVTPAAAGGIDGAFNDDNGHYHEWAIERLHQEGITNGCAPGRYCPDESVTRGQMAAFLNRALALPPASSPSGFVDTAGVFADDIERLQGAGITTGCEPRRYCPAEPVTRGQMAAFLNRALDLPPASSPSGLVDTAGVFADDIERLHAAGITVGCGGNLFCTGRAVTRGEMATFLVRAFGNQSVGVVARASSGFDQYTRSASESEWQWMRDNYSRLIVWSPYWDSRLQHFDDVLVYMNSYGIPVSGELAAQHPDWVMREADGTPTYIDFGCGASGGCPMYAGNLANPGFVAHQVQKIASYVAKGYPGLMLDDVNMLHRWSDVRGDEVTPIDTRTGSAITLAQWRRDLADYLTLIRTTFPELEIMHNSIWFSDSPAFDDPQVTRQIAAADYLMLERGANDAGLVAGTTRYGFRTFLSFIDRAHTQGTRVLLMEEDGEIDGQLYNLAATLLIDTGADLVGSESRSVTAPDSFWPGFQTDIGLATGSRRAVDGFIVREFADGLVVLREPRLGAGTFGLDGPMIDSSGRTVTAVSLTGGQAEILRTP